jgi:hypothetical protein
MQKNIHNLLGQTLQNFLVQELIIDIHKNKSRRRYICKCLSCGENKIVLPYNLLNVKVRCICQSPQKGLSYKHVLFGIWRNMLRRCNSPKCKSYADYGGRGVKVCERWLSLPNFVEDMYPSYKKGLLLERVNNAGNYEPSNCVWANSSQQSRNQRSNIYVEYDGKKMILKDLAVLLNIKPSTLYSRHRRGQTIV